MTSTKAKPEFANRPYSYPNTTSTTTYDELYRLDSNHGYYQGFIEQVGERHVEYSQKHHSRRRVYQGVTDDKNVWSSRIVLSFDGGGIRGLSGLLILQRLMEKIKVAESREWQPAKTSGQSPELSEKQELSEMDRLRKQFPLPQGVTITNDETADFLPCHYFDYIAGTSTGALIATMLGRMWMSVDRALDQFQALTARVYQVRYRTKIRAVKQMLNIDKSQVKIKKTVQSHFLTETKLRLNDDNRCRTIICSFEQEHSSSPPIPYLFRSYSASKPNSDFDNFGLSDVMRATACSPYNFSPVSIGSKTFCDTGLSWTNPTMEVWKEVLRETVQDSQKAASSKTLLLSIGGGYTTHTDTHKSKTTKPSVNFSRAQHTLHVSELVNQSLNTIGEEVDNFMKSIQSDGARMEYHRLNVPLDLAGVVPAGPWQEEVKELQLIIRNKTKEYLDSSDVDEKLEHVATELVRLRRQKSRTAKWEAFAFGVKYRCPLDREKHNCEIKNARVQQPELIEHLRKAQDIKETFADDDDRIRMLVKEARVYSD